MLKKHVRKGHLDQVTILAGIKFKDYIMIAADTRATIQHPHFGEKFIDGDHKIVNCNLGLVTGSGYVNAIDVVKSELIKREVKHTDEIVNMIKQKAIPEIEKVKKQFPNVEDKTCFMMTYFTSGEETKSRLVLFHPDYDYQLALPECIIILPTGFSENDFKDYKKELSEKTIPFENTATTQEEYVRNLINNIQHNIRVIAEIFGRVSNKTKYVSRDLDVAVHLITGDIFYVYGKIDDLISREIQIFHVPSSSPNTILTPDIL